MAQARPVENNLGEVLKQVAREKDIDFERWISALVSTTRAAHAALHNVETALDGTWTFSAALDPGIAETVKAPANSVNAAHSCNCLCTMVAFDPMHKEISVDYQSDLHVEICKAFEDRVDSWGAWLVAQMDPFYSAMTENLLTELARMG